MKSEESRKRISLSAVPPFWVFGAFFVYFLLNEITLLIVELKYGHFETLASVVAIPLAEDLLKLWLVIKLSKRAVSAILTFGLLEFCLSLVSVSIVLPEGENLLLISWIRLLPLMFHFATALAYGTDILPPWTGAVFLICLMAHIVFNGLALYITSELAWTFTALGLCIVVFAAGEAVRGKQANSQTGRRWPSLRSKLGHLAFI